MPLASALPLSGIRIIELAGIGPGPYAGQLLADMGADVIVVNRPGGSPPLIENRGKHSIIVDLQKPDGAEIVLKLCETADAIFEGLRPGVVERLGVGPEACHARNPKLVYGRMTGWGQTGPWATTAGHDLTYIAITGALAAMGEPGRIPTPPLNLVGDYGGGSLFLVNGLLAALLRAERTGEGDIIDAAIIDGVSSMMGLFYGLAGFGQWSPARGANMIDGGLPYYRCYETADGKYIAVGALEPQFFAALLKGLNIDPKDYGGQTDKDRHAAQITLLETTFKARTRDAWAAHFDGTDACVAPVLTYEEAPGHPQIKARGGLEQHGPYRQPRTAPAFTQSAPYTATEVAKAGAHTDVILTDLGLGSAEIEALRQSGTIA